MNQIKPGKYTARIVNYGIAETKAGDPVVKVLFEFEDEAGRRELTWTGFLTEKGAPITMKALLTCGLRGNDIAGLFEGVASGLLDAESPVQIDVDLEPGLKDKSKFYPTIKWVNRLGGASFGAALKPESKARLAGLRGAIMSARAETGIKDPGMTPKPKAPPQEGWADESDIGF